MAAILRIREIPNLPVVYLTLLIRVPYSLGAHYHAQLR